MGRLSIEIPEHQHQQIKALAALSGISIKDFILEKTLNNSLSPNKDEADALKQLEAFLKPRIEAARRSKVVSSKTVGDIIARAHRSLKND